MELIHAARVQKRVIFALMMREIRSRYGNRKLGFFWALFEPFAHIIVFIGLFTALGRAAPVGESIFVFLLTGIVPWLLYNNIVNSIMAGQTSNKALMGYPQVMPMDISISRIIIESSTKLIVFLLFLSAAFYLGIVFRINDFLQMIAPVGLIILLATGIGLINAAIIPRYPSYRNIYSALSRPLYFVSGIFFTASFLSPELYEILYYNPLLHLIEWFRVGFYPSFEGSKFDQTFAISVCIGIFTLGLISERVSSKRARQV